jgi:threonine aldolase
MRSSALGCTPAEMTWKSGVDMVSFGGTKNGCWCAEALVIFDPHLAAEFPFIRKRAAQLFSKVPFRRRAVRGLFPRRSVA